MTVAPAAAITRLPTAVLPVKPILATSRWLKSASPTVEPGPQTTFSTPLGSPASCINAATFSRVSGVVLAGLTTKVFPVTSPGPSLLPARLTGKFQGVMAAQTPSGRLRIRPSLRGAASRLGTEPPRRLLANPA